MIGDNSWIGEDAWLLNLEPITIGSNVCISQSVRLITGSHDRRSPTFEYDNAAIVVQDGAWIAVGASILRGVVIGFGATVGAHVVAHRDVSPGQIVTLSSVAGPNSGSLPEERARTAPRTERDLEQGPYRDH